MQTTANYGLKKPEGNDTVDIDVINGNMDTIDGQLKKLSSAMGDDPDFKTTVSSAISVKTNQSDFNNHVNALTAHGIGDRTQLKTAAKDTIVNALNELKIAIPSVPVQSVNGKTGSVNLGASDITVSDSSNHFSSNPKNVENVLAELFTSGTNGKNDIYNAISAKGTTPASKNFSDLVTGVQNIKTGYGIGDSISSNNLNLIHLSMDTIWSNYDVICAYAIAVDQLGNVYTAYNNSQGKTVRKFNSSGVEIWSISQPNAFDIAVNQSGDVYVAYADMGVGVRKYDSLGVEVWSSSSIRECRGIAVDQSGNLYVSGKNECVDNDIVIKFNSSGTEVWRRDDGCCPVGITIDQSGNVYVAYSSDGSSKKVSIIKYNTSGTSMWSYSGGAYANDVSVDNLGNVYVAYSSNKAYTVIEKLNNLGESVWRCSDFSYATGITVDVYGNVYVAYDEYTTVEKLSSSGKIIWTLPTHTSNYAKNLAVDQSGNVYVAYTNGVAKIYGSDIYTINS